MIYEPLYKCNHVFVSSLGLGENRKIKVVYMQTVRNSGIERPSGSLSEEEFKSESEPNRLRESTSRSKRKCFEYAFCNRWDYFFTGTIDPKKHDRTDLEGFHKTLRKWINNQNRSDNCEIRYLLIPEPHADGAVHVHGLLAGIPKEDLHMFFLGDIMGKTIAEKVRNGAEIYNWIPYSRKFGFCDLEPIKNVEAVSKYITKYITKEIAEMVPKGKQCFWHSRDLQGPTPLFSGTLETALPFEWDWEGEHASIYTAPYDDTLLCEIYECLSN